LALAFDTGGLLDDDDGRPRFLLLGRTSSRVSFEFAFFTRPNDDVGSSVVPFEAVLDFLAGGVATVSGSSSSSSLTTITSSDAARDGGRPSPR